MNAGDLRQRVTFRYVASETQDDYGSVTPNWDDIATDPTVWAKVEAVSGSTYRSGQLLQSDTTHLITIRRRDDLTTDMYVVFNGEYLEIRSIRVDWGRHKEYTRIEARMHGND